MLITIIMPSRTKKVRFETEYNSSFKAFDEDVYRSPLLEALVDKPDVKATYNKSEKIAGLQSHKFIKSLEPPLQHKKFVLNNDDPNIEYVTADNNPDVPCSSKTKKNKALEFKAGLRPEVTKKKHPVSEYKRQYEWKKSPNDSPLLNAEKIIFDSHTNIPRFVRDKVPRKTEYQSKFAEKPKRWNAKKENEAMEEQNEDIPTSTVKRFLQTSQNPDIPFFPHGSNRVCHTEYQANFGSPKKFKYQEGIWLGAKPAHLLPDDSTQESAEGVPNWFEEVLELREKARQYKTRALEGNYFSRDFLVKLDAEFGHIYGEQSDSNDSRDGKRFKNQEMGSERSKQSNMHDAAVVPHTVPMKQDWASDSSDDAAGRNVYKDLNQHFKSVSSDETLSSCSHDEHLNESIERDPPQDDKEKEKQQAGKTFSKKSPSRLTTTPRTTRGNSPLLQEGTGGSDASSERSESSRAKCSTKSANLLNRNLKTYKPTARKSVDPDRFNVETIRGIQSNDVEVMQSSSVQSNYGSENSEKLRGNEFENGNMSDSSFASRESLARQTLTRAKQRDLKFWKK